ncbi:hypothetical protein EYE40_04110 [Glaciihabitans arcticus]|uniref:Uncharacterized protein n=1 Tax=Glaciihabitans arcticus TaxID=2668039 RepID=A0A4Q9GPF7_9MICO|nr:hypothetical protein [Glaciihabitans arcticus]TBN56646.1 hypothetical protein EYE40_04110 [Glaciihabitans arcticus]
MSETHNNPDAGAYTDEHGSEEQASHETTTSHMHETKVEGEYTDEHGPEVTTEHTETENGHA